MMSKKKLITQSTVLDRPGWTRAVLKRLLGEPDNLAPNPHARTHGAPMRLFDLARVAEAEGTSEFVEMSKAVSRRREAAKRSAEARRKELLAKVETMPIDVRPLPIGELRSRAIEHFNDRVAEFEMRDGRGRTRASIDSDPEFLDRITVNYVRHHLTDYDRTIASELASRPGVDDAVVTLKERVLDAIGEAYPDLEEETWRQSGAAWA